MFARLYSVIILLYIAPACDSLRNSADRVSIECGLPKQGTHDASFIKILSSDGSGFSSSDIRALKAYFRSIETESGSDLPITNNGCLALPHENGIVQVLDTRNGESISLNIAKKSPIPALTRLKLQPKHDLQVSLTCTKEGLFASRSLEQPLFINFAGDASGLDMRLDLYSTENTYIKTLFRKPMGEMQLRIPSQVPVDDIPEGAYLLKVYGHHISEGIHSKPHLLNPDKNCSLFVLRGEVKVGGMEETQSIPVYPPSTQLPWSTRSSYESLYFCQEPRPNGSGPLKLLQSCEAHSNCLDSKNFKKVPFVRTEQVGIYDFFVYAENKVGDRSALSCQTLIVSDKSPEISISWRHEDLKRDGAILRKPYAILKADIEIDHSFLKADHLEKNLSCKVEFEIKGKNLFADQGVICTEGRCKGQSLANFIPCDKQLGFTLVDSLDQSMLLSSRLILKVRADDGAGHAAVAEKSVWINHSTWEKESLEYKIDTITQKLNSYLIDSTGDIIATFGFSNPNEKRIVAVYRSGSWVPLRNEESSCNCKFELTKTRDGTILVARTVEYASGLMKRDVFRYKNNQLEPVTSLDNASFITKCLSFLGGLNEDAYCAGTLNSVYHLVQGVWHKLPDATGTGPDSESSVDWRVFADGRLVGTAAGAVYIWDGTRWSSVTLKVPGPKPYFQLIEDFRGRIWVFLFEANGKFAPSLNLLVGDRLVRYEAPAPFDIAQPNSRPQSSSMGGLASFTVGFQKFNFSTDTWSTIDYPLPSVDGTAVLSESNKNFIVTANKGFFEDNGTLLYWPLKGLGYPCTNSCGGMERFHNYLYFKDSSKDFISLVRFRTLPVASFNSQMLSLRDSFSPGNWLDPAGDLAFAFADGLELTLLKDRVAFSKLPLTNQTLSTVRLPSKRYCIQTWAGLFIYEDPKQGMQQIWDQGPGRAHYCTEDRLGNLWWVDGVEHVLYKYDGKQTEPVENFGKVIGEELSVILSVLNNSLTVITTSNRVVLLNADGSPSASYSLGDIAGDLAAIKIIKAGKVSDSELLIEVQQSATEKMYFIIDVISGRITEDLELKKLVGKYLLQQIKFNGTMGYGLTKNPDATVLRRAQGQWKVIATFDDMKPFLIRKVVPPYQLAPDPYGRVWLHTTAPNNLLRLDPDWTP